MVAGVQVPEGYATSGGSESLEFHIAIAIEVGAEALLSFDTDQIALAEAAGLKVFTLGN